MTRRAERYIDAVSATVIVPARLASSRLPQKVLLAETGRPLVQHVVDRCADANGVGRVVVAADDPSIVAALETFGTSVVLTSPACRTGTERVAEAAATLGLADDALVFNVQGDEPEIDSRVLTALAARMDEADAPPMGTAWVAFPNGADVANPNLVKVVVDASGGRCLWFSRSPIPFARQEAPHYRLHVGIYAFRVGFLKRLATLPPTPAELAESLEQLRVLEHGHSIAAVEAHDHRGGIDTPEQYAAFVGRWKDAGNR